MNDLNDDLLEMFRRREGDIRSPVSPPTQLVARTRRREWLSAGISIVAAAIVVAVSIAGLRSLGSPDGPQPGTSDRQRRRPSAGSRSRTPSDGSRKTPSPSASSRTRRPPDAPDARPHVDQGRSAQPGRPRMPTDGGRAAGAALDDRARDPLAVSGEASAAWPVPLRTWAGSVATPVVTRDGAACVLRGQRRGGRSKLDSASRPRRPTRIELRCWTRSHPCRSRPAVSRRARV